MMSMLRLWRRGHGRREIIIYDIAGDNGDATGANVERASCLKAFPARLEK